MRQKLSLKPQDVALFVKIILQDSEDWLQAEISYELGISQGEVAKSISRLKKCGLVFDKKVIKASGKEFLIHGFKYSFPRELMEVGIGVSTAVSAPFFKKEFLQSKSEKFVWPSIKGEDRGQMIVPLYPKLAEASLKDKEFYKFMSALELIRSPRVREQKVGKDFILKELK